MHFFVKENHVDLVIAPLPIYLDEIAVLREEFVAQNNQTSEEQLHVCAQNACEIAKLTA